MATLISCDAFLRCCLLLFGLVLVAALCTRRGGRSPTRVDVRGVCRLPARLRRMEDGFPQGRTGHDSSRTRLQGVDTSSFEVYARQFEEAIERIRLRTTGSRRREGR